MPSLEDGESPLGYFVVPRTNGNRPEPLRLCEEHLNEDLIVYKRREIAVTCEICGVVTV